MTAPVPKSDPTLGELLMILEGAVVADALRPCAFTSEQRDAARDALKREYMQMARRVAEHAEKRALAVPLDADYAAQAVNYERQLDVLLSLAREEALVLGTVSVSYDQMGRPLGLPARSPAAIATAAVAHARANLLATLVGLRQMVREVGPLREALREARGVLDSDAFLAVPGGASVIAQIDAALDGKAVGKS